MKIHPASSKPSLLLLLLALAAGPLALCSAHGASFTYQGRLNSDAGPASGNYDFSFTLYDAPAGGAALGMFFLAPAVAVSNGLFTVLVNTNGEFGPTAFTGAPRWLEIGVRSNGLLANFTTLSPRQSLDVTPFAAFAFNAGTANVASLANSVAPGAVGAAQIASNAITASQLAPGAAAANLAGSGLAGLPSSGIVLSDREVNRALEDAGFNSLGVSFGGPGELWTALPPGPPATGTLVPARARHRAVWSGTEVLIIGGDPENRGLRYNPAANTWSLINPSNAPAIGSEVHAFWTGTQLIVWDAYHRVGGRYTPGTDTWTAMSDTNAPSARAGSSAAFANGYLVVWGGTEAEDEWSYLNTGGRYNPTNNTWIATSLANVPQRRAGATATAIGTDIIIFGGTTTNLQTGTNVVYGPYSDFGRQDLANGARYNPFANTWTAIADAPSGRQRHTASWSGTYVLVWGGTAWHYNAPLFGGDGEFYEAPVASGLRYNPATDTWSAMSTNGQPVVATGHSSAWSSTGSLMIWGGDTWPSYCYISSCGFAHTYTNGGARYSPGTDTWSPMAATVAEARFDHAAVWTGSQMILWGGEKEFGTTLADGMRYNLAANTWSTMAAPPATGEPGERTAPSAVWAGDTLIVWGGENQGVALRTGGIYRSGVGWTNTPVEGAPSARKLHSAVWTGNEMIVWGGVAGIGSVPVNTGARFNVSSNRWFPVTLNGAPRARAQHTAVWTGTEMIVFGGYDYTNVFYPTWLGTGGRYNPATDTWTPIGTNVFAAAAGHTAVWTGTNMIVWGGYTHNGGLFPPINYRNTGFSYDPAANTWSFFLPSSGLSGRRFHTAVWSGDEMLIWGGYGTTGATNTGAAYSPALNSWRPISSTNAPGNRHAHTAVWAEPPGQMIVWGGDTGSLSLSDGGSYDPFANKWTPITNSPPPTARYQHVAVWSGAEMLIFDGEQHSGTELNTGASFRPRKIFWLYQKP